MIDALHISQSGLKATQEWLDHISNNVANMQTAGYKKTSVHFVDMVSSVDSQSGTNSVGQRITNQIGVGTRLGAPTIDFSVGSFKPTFRSLDVAINGAGFLEVISADGDVAYTRLGKLSTNKDGYLTTVGGQLLSDNIQVPTDVESVEILSDGTILAKFSDDQSAMELGQIQLALISNAEAMTSIGNGLFVTTEKTGDAIMHEPGRNGTGKLMQGFLEMANVDLVEEMTNLVLAQRAYQLNARIIQTADQILETVNNLRR